MKKIRKILTSGVSAIIAIFLTFSCAFSEGTIVNLDEIDGDSSAFYDEIDLSGAGSSLFLNAGVPAVAGDYGIMSMDMNGEWQYINKSRFSGYVQSACYFNGSIYALTRFDDVDSTLYIEKMTGDNVETVTAVQLENGYTFSGKNLVITDDYTGYFLCETNSGSGSLVECSVSPNAKKSAKGKVVDTSFTCITLVANDLYGIKQEGNVSELVKIADDETVLVKSGINSQIECMSSSEDNIYMLEKNKVMRFSTKEGSFTQCAWYYCTGIDYCMVSSANNLYIGSSGTVDKIKADENALGAVTIRVAGMGDQMREVIAAFAKKYPNIAVDTIDRKSSTAEEVRQLIQTGDCDAYVIACQGSDFVSLMDKGYCQPLSGEGAESLKTRMYPNISEAIMKDGNIYGVPIMVSCETLGINEATFHQVSSENVPQTFEEVMMVVKSCLEGIKDNTSISLFDEDAPRTLIKYFITNKAAQGDINFDDDETRKFFSMLDEALAEMKKSAAMNEDSEDFIIGDMPGNVFSSYHQVMPSYDGYDGSAPLLPQGMIPMEMYALCVVPGSKNMDEAITFADFVADNLSQATKLSIFADEDTPIESEEYLSGIDAMNADIEFYQKGLKESREENKDIWQDNLDSALTGLATLNSIRYVFSPEDIAVYKTVAPRLKVVEGVDGGELYSAAETITDRYVDGQITSQQYLQELNRIAAMIKAEVN